MSDAFPLAPLGDVLDKSAEQIALEPTERYKQITVRLWGKGVTLRDEVTGAEIAAERRYVVRAGQFILSRIDARNGAFGIVPDALDGGVVSTDFPVFNVNMERMDPAFLGWMSKTAAFVDLCKAASEGTTNRVRLKEDKFLVMQIPLPPIADQRHIVARIEELAARITEARGLRQRSNKEAEVLVDAVVGATFSQVETTTYKPLAMIASKIGSGSTPSGGRASYPATGIPFIRSMNVRMRRFQYDDIAFITPETHRTMKGTKVQPGDVLLNITGASIGRVAVAPYDLVEANVNQHVAIIRPRDMVLSKYLMYWLSQPKVQGYINDEQKGATRQGFTKAQIERFEVPLVSIPEQQQIIAHLDNAQAKVDAVKRLQAETAAELDALLPSVLDRAFRGAL